MTQCLEGRKREERVSELRNLARHKRALTPWRGGRGRSGSVSFETWHVTNKHSPTGGGERAEPARQLPNLARHQLAHTQRSPGLKCPTPATRQPLSCTHNDSP